MWQVITITILLALMIGLSFFDITLPDTPFDPKSLAATGFIVLAAFTTGELFKRFNIPALLGYIAAGIVFGPNLVALAYELGVDAFPTQMARFFSQQPTALFGFCAAWNFFVPLLVSVFYALGGDAFPTQLARFSPEHPTALVRAKVIEDLALINILTVGVIGTMGGGELKLSDIRETWQQILLLTVLIIFTALPLTMAVVMGLTYLPFDLVSFLQDQDTMNKVAAALLFAILAIAMSPAATLAIIQETKARGKFTSLVLGMVVVADLALVALFLVGLSLAKLLVAPEGFSMPALLGALPGIGLEFAWALVIGSVAGVAFILYIRYVEREMLLFTVAAIFTTSFACKILHAETLLAFLTAGFIVQNFSRHGHDLIHALEKISLPVFIIYFMTQAAQLDLKGVMAFLPLTLILATVRALSFYGSARIVTSVMKTDETTQANLWLSFLSRGGVDLVLAAMVAGVAQFAWGKDFQTVIMSTVVVHIVLGPPLLKFALGRAGETADGRQRSIDADRDLDAMQTGDLMVGGDFPKPEFEDRYLNQRLFELRDALLRLHKEYIATPFGQRKDKLSGSIDRAQREIDAALERLSELLERRDDFESNEDLARAMVKLHTQSRRKLQEIIQGWESMEPLAFTAKQAEVLIAQIQDLEDFEDHFIVDLEDEFYQPQTALLGRVRWLRRLRRLQRPIAGRGRRTIPSGRLWRYYIELSIPRYLAQASVRAALEHEEFWFELGCHLRELDHIFGLTIQALDVGDEIGIPMTHIERPTQDDAHEEHDDGHHGGHHDDDGHGHHDDDGHEEEAEETFVLRGLLETVREEHADLQERAVAFLAQARAHHARCAQELRAQLDEAIDTATQGYSWSLQQAYSAFLDACARAGTLELPGFEYRPSTQFDQARRSTRQLFERLSREAEIVSAYIGWVVLDHQLVIFAYWLENYQQRISDTLRGPLREQSVRQLQRLQTSLELDLEAEGATPPDDWIAWKNTQVVPASRAARRALDRALISFGQGVTSRRLIDTLEYRVAGFSEELNLLLQDPDTTRPGDKSLSTLSLRVRQWFSTKLVNEIALRYIEFNERIKQVVQHNLVGLDSVDQILEYNLHAAEKERGDGEEDQGVEVATSALVRASKLVGQLIESLETDIEDVEAWILQETAVLSERAVGPFLHHTLEDVHQKLIQHSPSLSQSDSWFARMVGGLKERLRIIYETLAPLYEEVLEDVRSILVTESRPQRRAMIREHLDVMSEQRLEMLPPIYRRLFNPVPLDLPEFYVERTRLEAKVLEAIATWGNGASASILLSGDRGIGKRTLIHNLVPIRIYDLAPSFQETPIQTIRLGEEVETEAQLCAEFDSLFQGEAPRTFVDMARQIRTREQRQIMIVENATKCFQRTTAGLDLCRDFLNMIDQTSDKILWILLMDSPASTLLDTMMDLYDYFSHVFEIEAFSSEDIERMIMNRHQVSGFEVDFDAPSLRLLYRTRHPLAASEAARNPRREFFQRLGELSRGNPLLALLCWLRAIELDAQDDTLLHIRPMDGQRPELVGSLTLPKRLILSLLLQHASLDAEQLSGMLQRPKQEVHTDLLHLMRLGFVEVMVGTSQCYQLRDLAAPLVTFELREQNLV